MKTKENIEKTTENTLEKNNKIELIFSKDFAFGKYTFKKNDIFATEDNLLKMDLSNLVSSDESEKSAVLIAYLKKICVLKNK